MTMLVPPEPSVRERQPSESHGSPQPERYAQGSGATITKWRPSTPGLAPQQCHGGRQPRILHLRHLQFVFQAVPVDRARMVGVVNPPVTDQELRQMHDAGVRGIRFNLSPPGATTLDMIEPLAKRIEPMGWHCQINAPADQIVGAQDIFLRVPGRLVFDHLAHAPDVDSPSYQLVRRLIDKGNTWIKLSGAYGDTKSGPPEYADRLAVAQGYARAAPERVVWGSDWPHPSEAADKKPNDAVLFDLLAVWVPDEAARHRVLVENPAKLYDFPAG
jgi:predicted TIM-barrel fold metal-dependent hydrolase